MELLPVADDDRSRDSARFTRPSDTNRGSLVSASTSAEQNPRVKRSMTSTSSELDAIAMAAEATSVDDDEDVSNAVDLAQTISLGVTEDEHDDLIPRGTPRRRPTDTISLSNPSTSMMAPMRRNDSDRSISSTSSDRKRNYLVKSEDRSGYARIYFENQSFTSSTVFKLTPTTTVLEVRKSMANKIKIPSADFSYYVIVLVYPSDNARSMSARTLRDDELVLPLVEKLNRARASIASSEDMANPPRPKPKHRSRPPLKFILKDVRGAPLDLDEDQVKKETTEAPGLTVPALIGKGVRSGYLQKASVKDTNVWRKRWFVVKDDQLLYCKSATNQRDVTAISLLGAYLAKARPEVKVPFSFELRTPRRIYQLCANSKEDMVQWIHALHVQIGISTENHRLYEAEILITEDAVSRNEEVNFSPLSEPSLLQRVLAREDSLKAFRDYAYAVGAQPLLDTWIQCELFRRNCLEREIGGAGGSGKTNKRSAKEEWEHLGAIIEATEALSMINAAEVKQLRESFQSELINRRLSLALHASMNIEYPRVELIAAVHQKIFEAIENGPFKQFLNRHGYRVLLERVMGRIV
ncbi:hypothetical protein Poli38472_006341 [Pythium oligandrum]|uniref:PH domain-containing protein n=2 Tax=Pythiaceae TaxID=4782 RepID=A0A8K1C4F1_PYTOL|nr:hypothetical protein Poli38472_006341 [Pythium oligandrum]DAZ94283.1 TPA: hypothetical protein N0F65_010880 [Lagenidium giganteum]|eukprot:TMW56331.1 hypothetical protein Poli38472_006341 [Pythium oligandrum]